jgi:hypothetical protein
VVLLWPKYHVQDKLNGFWRLIHSDLSLYKRLQYKCTPTRRSTPTPSTSFFFQLVIHAVKNCLYRLKAPFPSRPCFLLVALVWIFDCTKEITSTRVLEYVVTTDRTLASLELFGAGKTQQPPHNLLLVPTIRALASS